MLVALKSITIAPGSKGKGNKITITFNGEIGEDVSPDDVAEIAQKVGAYGRVQFNTDQLYTNTENKVDNLKEV